MLDLKRKMFADLAGIVAPSCILASNTSTLSIASIARDVPEPGRVCGMHFFNPAPLMPLVEVIRGAADGRGDDPDGDRPGRCLGQVARQPARTRPASS